MSDVGVSVENRLFADDVANDVVGGVLVLLTISLVEALVRSLLFASSSWPPSHTYVHQQEVYSRLFHLRDLRTLVAGERTTQCVESLESSHRTPRVKKARVLVPLVARLAVLALDLILVYYGGTRILDVNDTSLVPTMPAFDVPKEAVANCFEYLPEVRGMKERASVNKCIRKFSRGRPPAMAPLSGVSFMQSVQEKHSVFVVGTGQGLLEVPEFHVKSQYIGIDGEVVPLFLFGAPPAGTLENPALNESTVNVELLDTVLSMASQRAGFEVNKTFEYVPRLKQFTAVISIVEIDILSEAFSHVLEERLGIGVIGDEKANWSAVELPLAQGSVYRLEQNRIGNTVFASIILSLSCILVVLRCMRPYSASDLAYRAFVEHEKGDCLAGPTAQPYHDREAVFDVRNC